MRLETKNIDGSGAPPEMSAELKKLNTEVKDALVSMREGLETRNAATVKKVEEWLTAYEAKAAEYHRSLAAHQKQVLDTKEALESRVKDLEVSLAGKGDGGGADLERKSAEYTAFFDMIKKSNDQNAQIETKVLRTDSAVGAGYLVPKVMDGEIRKNITEVSPVRRYARVRPAPGKTVEIPRRLALPRAYYEGEAAASTALDGSQKYGLETITLHRLPAVWEASQDMLNFAAWDMEREIVADTGEMFGYAEGYNFVKGTGSKSPAGFMVDSRIELHTTAASGTVTFADIANTTGKLKRGQNPMWFFNRRTLAHLWTIYGSDGHPVWQPVKEGEGATIFGYRYDAEFIDMDDAQNGSNAKPMAFGDMRRCYEIFDYTGTTVIRDQFTRAKEGIVVWTFTRYNDGRVIVPEAMKILKIQ